MSLRKQTLREWWIHIINPSKHEAITPKWLPQRQSKSKSTTYHCRFETKIKLFASRKWNSLVLLLLLFQIMVGNHRKPPFLYFVVHCRAKVAQKWINFEHSLNKTLLSTNVRGWRYGWLLPCDPPATLTRAVSDCLIRPLPASVNALLVNCA